MSLLDDVSIVVTPNGYKAGTLYGVLPTATEGSELVTNGGFELNSDWNNFSTPTTSEQSTEQSHTGTYSWKIIAGATQQGIQSPNNFSLTSGLRYKVSLWIYSVSGNSIKSGLNNTNVSVFTERTVIAGQWTNITYEAIATSTGASYISILSQNSLNFYVDNVSVKEITNSDMDVTRATAATRVDENGLVNYAEVLGSELVSCGSFDCADPDAVWSRGTGWTISGGVATQSSGNGQLSQTGILTANKLYSVTVVIDSINVGGELNVVLGSAAPNLTFTETATKTGVASANEILYLLGNSTFSGSISNISIKEVTRNNVPRIDYTGGGCPHILSEPQRTNLITYSEDLTQGATNRLSVTPNATTSPDGTNTADKLIPNNTSSTYHYFAINSLSINSNYRYSVYLKKSEYEYALINFETSGTSGSSKNAIINLNNGNIESTNFTSVSVTSEGNGWYRCSVQATASRTSIAIYPLPSSDTGSFTGDNTSGIFAWGIQLEESSYTTSYIPTSGSTVTRNQDVFTRDGIASLINSEEGVLFVEVAVLSDDSTLKSITLSDSTTGNRVIINYSNASNRLTADVRLGGVGQAFMQTFSYTITNFLKIALKYKENDFALWVNGTEVATDTSGSTFTANTLNRLGFDNGGSGELLFSKVRQVQVFKTALTDAQLAALTT